MFRRPMTIARFALAFIAAALLLVPAGQADAKRRSSAHWSGHGNSKWSKGTLTVGQTRRAIASAIAKQHSKLGGLRMKPSDVNVTLKLAPDGKTALWRATPKAKRGSSLAKLASFGKTSFEFKGTVDVSLRNPTKQQINDKAFSIFKGRKTATAKTDWSKAKKQLTKYGRKPRETTIAKLAYKLFKGRKAATAKSDWQRAEKQLKLDLDSGSRVTFLNSSKSFNAASKRLFSVK